MDNPKRGLPDGYVEKASIDLKRDYALMLRMQLWGLAALAASVWLFWRLMLALRPDAGEAFWTGASAAEGSFSISLGGAVILGFFAALVLMVVVHEAVHGLFFFLFTGKRPLFGFKVVYAYAAAPPGTYLSVPQYAVVALAPLVVLTAAAVLLLPIAPLWALPALYFFLVGNTSGSIGDVMVVLWLLRQPPGTLVQDHGDAMIAYAPELSGG
jgi:hypothetical protein